MTTANPFRKETAKPSTISIQVTADQRAIIEELGAHLEIKTNTGVVMEALAVLHEKYKRQLTKPAAGETAAGK